MNNIENWYKRILTKDFIYKRKISNIFDLPNLDKICLKMNNKKTIQNTQNIFLSFSFLEVLTNQKPKICLAKNSIANFKVQKKMPLSCKLTLRKKNKDLFLQLFLYFIFPRIEMSIRKNKSNFDVGIKNLLFIPQLAIINSFSLNDFGFNISFNFNSKDLDLFLSGLQVKSKYEETKN